jgi:thiol-disulfide isomerase/thioredoxin
MIEPMRTRLRTPRLGRLVAALVACALLGSAAAQRPTVGQPFPDFALRDAAGVLVTNADLHGRAWMLNVWATWCRPCRTELPLLARVADELEGGGLGLLLVNAAERAGVASGYLAAEGLALRTLVDPDAAEAGLETTTQFMRRIRSRGLPTTYFIDAEGIVRSLYVGELLPETIGEHLATLGLTWRP